MQNKWQIWSQLMRIDRPIGFFLLLWPTLWSLWLVKKTVPDIKTLVVFVLGVFFMRTAGCVINDYKDRKIDGYVKRTHIRPLPNGKISERNAKLLFSGLIGISFLLVLTFNILTIALSMVGLVLIWIYPLMKRYTYLPQLILGIAFSWPIPMVFTALNESLQVNFWLLFLSNTIWTIAYDTQYAMIDRDDDIIVGIKSTAVLFGQFDKIIIGLLQIVMLLLLIFLGLHMKLGNSYYFSILVVLILFVWQHILLIKQEREAYFKAFLNNNFVGMVIFIGILLSLM